MSRLKRLLTFSFCFNIRNEVRRGARRKKLVSSHLFFFNDKRTRICSVVWCDVMLCSVAAGWCYNTALHCACRHGHSSTHFGPFLFHHGTHILKSSFLSLGNLNAQVQLVRAVPWLDSAQMNVLQLSHVCVTSSSSSCPSTLFCLKCLEINSSHSSFWTSWSVVGRWEDDSWCTVTATAAAAAVKMDDREGGEVSTSCLHQVAEKEEEEEREKTWKSSREKWNSGAVDDEPIHRHNLNRLHLLLWVGGYISGLVCLSHPAPITVPLYSYCVTFFYV